MIDSGRIASNFLSLTFAQVVAFACGLGTTILLARGLGPASYGLLGFGQAFIGFATLAVVNGTDTFGARTIARTGNVPPSLVSHILGLRLALAAAVVPAVLAIAYGIGLPGRTANVIAIQALGAAVAVISVDFVFQGIQRMGLIAIRQSAASVLVLAGTALLVSAPDDVYVAAVLPVVALAATSVWMASRLTRLGAGIRPRFDRAAWRGILAVSIPIGLGGFSVAVFQYTDVLMLGFVRPEEEVGRYVAMGRLYIIIVTAGNLLSAVFAPVLARVHDDPSADRSGIFRRFLLSILAFGGPASAGVAALPGHAMDFLFGADYRADGPVLVIVMLAAFAFLVSVATSTALVAWNDERFHVKALAASAVVNIALNFALIPAFGLAGAAFATFAAVVLLAGAEAYRLSRRHGVAVSGDVLRCTALIALPFGGAALASELAAGTAVAAHPGVALAVFGGAAFAIFATAATASGIVRPGRIVAALFGRGL